MKITGINWQAINENIGIVDNRVHPFMIIADWLNDNSHSTSMEFECLVWDAASLMTVDIVAGVRALEELTDVNKTFWLHVWIIYMAGQE
jgi:hypothetical protein